jgi:hypothetical protein
MGLRLEGVYPPFYKRRQVVHVALSHLAGQVRAAGQPGSGRAAGARGAGAGAGGVHARGDLLEAMHSRDRSRDAEDNDNRRLCMQDGRNGLRGCDAIKRDASAFWFDAVLCAHALASPRRCLTLAPPFIVQQSATFDGSVRLRLRSEHNPSNMAGGATDMDFCTLGMFIIGTLPVGTACVTAWLNLSRRDRVPSTKAAR